MHSDAILKTEQESLQHLESVKHIRLFTHALRVQPQVKPFRCIELCMTGQAYTKLAK